MPGLGVTAAATDRHCCRLSDLAVTVPGPRLPLRLTHWHVTVSDSDPNDSLNISERARWVLLSVPPSPGPHPPARARPPGSYCRRDYIQAAVPSGAAQEARSVVPSGPGTLGDIQAAGPPLRLSLPTLRPI